MLLPDSTARWWSWTYEEQALNAYNWDESFRALLSLTVSRMWRVFRCLDGLGEDSSNLGGRL
jgi:hypothetical protein